jgi:hypothetical protein
MKLGNLVTQAGLTKSNLMEALKLGFGAGLFPFAYGLIQSQLLLRASPQMFAQNSYGEYAARALSGVVLGSLTTKVLKQPMMGDGMVASAVGSVFRDLAAPMFNPAAKAAQDAIRTSEEAGMDQMSGVNPLGRGLAGLGTGLGYTYNPTALFGVGTNAGSVAGMFDGATVAIESGGNLSGATVAIEPSGFASSLT